MDCFAALAMTIVRTSPMGAMMERPKTSQNQKFFGVAFF